MKALGLAFLLGLASVGGAPAASTGEATSEASAFDRGLSGAARAYENGDPLAAAEVGDLFYSFEESSFRDSLAAKDPDLYKRLEAEWLSLRRLMKSGAPVASVRTQAEVARRAIAEAREQTGAVESSGALFWGSFLIILREGFEALLIIAALAAYLRKAKAGERIRDLYAGAAAALAASLVLWAASKTVIRVSGAQTELIEGLTMLLASGVLFYVSYWLVSKVQAARWQAFIARQVHGAIARGGRAAMIGVSFLVVFREGFETVLFYEALGASTPASSGVSTIAAGLVAGAVVLGVLYYAIHRLGMRLQIGAFFAVTGSLLYWMAFKFAGDGMRELQEAGVLGESPLPLVPEWSFLQAWFGVYPFVETLSVQALLLAAVIVGLAITFRAERAAPAAGAGTSGGEARRSVA